MNRYTPEFINELEPNEIFCFGSNEVGLHFGGAAAVAYQKFGAKWGEGAGLQGNSYAIPTLDGNFKQLPLDKIQHYVKGFIANAILRPDLTFLVTKLGCGIAGFAIEDIAPLFAIDNLPKNIILPIEFTTT